MRMAYLWLLQALTGLAILVLSVIHLASIHTRVIGRLFGADTASAAGPTGGSWPAVIVFISAVILIHALIGLRQTLLELSPSAKGARVISLAIVIADLLLLSGVVLAAI